MKQVALFLYELVCKYCNARYCKGLSVRLSVRPSVKRVLVTK